MFHDEGLSGRNSLVEGYCGFLVGFYFWELNGFYSVTGHRVRELSSRDF
jgi:hypothetical protein